MAETYHNLTLIFPEGKTANKFYKKLKHASEEYDEELITMLNDICEINIDLDDDDFDEFYVENLECTNNVIDLKLITGQSEYPEEFITAFTSAGAETICISIANEYEDAPEKYYYHKGLEVTDKKKINSLIEKSKADPYTEFILALKRFKYKKANKLFKSLDVNEIQIDDEELLTDLVGTVEFADITLALIKKGLMDNHNEYIDALDNAIIHANLEVVKGLVKRMPDSEIIKHSGEIVKSSLICKAYEVDGNSGFEQIKWLVPLLEEKGVDLNQVTEDGSPLWIGYDYQNNIPGVRFLQNRGGISIAPSGFYNSLSDLEKVRQAASHDDLSTLQKLNILANKQWVDEVIFRTLFNRSYSILIWLTEQNIRINWNGIPKINWEGVPNDARTTYLEGLPLYQLPFRRYHQICDDEITNFILESVAKTINSTEPVTKLLCIFTSLAYSDELLRRTHALGAELSEVVKFEGGDNAFMEDTYPLLVAIESEKIENIECLLELGATIPQDLDITIDPVKYVTENYLAAERKKALKVLKKYGYE